jgi:hypothetical protein
VTFFSNSARFCARSSKGASSRSEQNFIPLKLA